MNSEQINQLLSELNNNDPTTRARATLIINGMKVMIPQLNSLNGHIAVRICAD